MGSNWVVLTLFSFFSPTKAKVYRITTYNHTSKIQFILNVPNFPPKSDHRQEGSDVSHTSPDVNPISRILGEWKKYRHRNQQNGENKKLHHRWNRRNSGMILLRLISCNNLFFNLSRAATKKKQPIRVSLKNGSAYQNKGRRRDLSYERHVITSSVVRERNLTTRRDFDEWFSPKQKDACVRFLLYWKEWQFSAIRIAVILRGKKDYPLLFFFCKVREEM